MSALGPQLAGMSPGMMRCPYSGHQRNPDAVVRVIQDWVQNYLAAPHAELGRTGAVCPFTPEAIVRNTVRISPVYLGEDRESEIEAALMAGKNAFLEESRKVSQAKAMYYSSIFVFPEVSHEEASFVIEKVKDKLKPDFVDMGLMLGEFYEGNTVGGLHNADFHPLQSPIPMLVIRYMVPSDIVFLDNPSLDLDRRLGFLRSYLKHQDAISPKERKRVAALIANLDESDRQAAL